MKKLLYILLTLSMALPFTGCVDDDPSGDSYYTFTGEMVTDYLKNREETFSEFIGVLQRAELWDFLSTYRDFTCFAPTNAAIDDYLKKQGLRSIDDLSDAECDTLAWTHLLKAAYYTTDLGEGSLPSTNMNERYLTLTCDTSASNGGNVVYRINGAEMVVRDDSVENGVMHVVNEVLTSSSVLIGELVCNDPNLTLFSQALVATGLADSLVAYIDNSYSVSADSSSVTSTSQHKRTFGNNTVYWRYPSQRIQKFTVFAETDDVFKAKGIETLEDLTAYAKEVYDETYPNDAGKYDDDPTNRRNPLNRFVAYHILDRYASYSEMTVSEAVFNIRQYFQTNLQDIQEFYETLCPHTIMKVCDAVGNKYINRRGVGARYNVIGSKILSPTESKALNPNYSDSPNGIYFYIDRILTYNKKETIDQVLNIRMRIDATTLSPDFMNAGARNINPSSFGDGISFLMTGFKPGFAKNFIFSDDTFFGVHNRFWCNSWESDMCACLDNFDIKFRIPPVPSGQTYEIRLGYVCGTNRTVVQVYLDDNLTGDIPCGIPVDLRKYAFEYGWESDADLVTEEAIEANDKALRNNGYMKSYDACSFPNGEFPRDAVQCMRRILTTKYLEDEHDYYIRLRQVLDNNAEMSLDYIEIVPKSVYNGSTAEDKH